MTLPTELLALLDDVNPGRDDAGPRTDDGDRVALVKWKILAPPARNASRDGEFDHDIYGDEEWSPDFPEDWVQAIDDALESGEAPSGPEAPCGTEAARGATHSVSPHRCAWYVALHHSSTSFGIYIREACVLKRAVRIAARLPRGTPRSGTLLRSVYRAAAYELFLHEQFHHKIESFGFRLLVVENAPKYLAYKSHVYQSLFGTNACLEEALANADAHRRLSEPTYFAWIGQSVLRATRQALEASWQVSPPGYNQAARYLSDASYTAALAVLKAQVHEGLTHPLRTTPWKVSGNLAESIFPITSHIYTVFPVGTSPLMPIR
ncbi:hypothetical protein [Rhodococcus aetherivorans]